LKRALQVLGDADDRAAVPPLHVSISGRVISVADPHDGSAAARFVSHLRGEGAVDAEQSPRADLQIVVRSVPQSHEARLRADAMEEAADIVLGSPRASFARRLVRAYSSEAARRPGPRSTESASSP